MADDVQGSPWPVPKFNFAVDIDGVATDLTFQEVSGLDIESQVIEYRSGQSGSFSPIRMPGIREHGNVTLKRGIFARDSAFWDWFANRNSNTARRANVTIRLLDESGNPVMMWALTNAWPTKFTGPGLDATGNEVAVETIELAHEGLTVS